MRITVHSPEKKPVAAVGARLPRAVAEALAARGIALHTGQRLEEVESLVIYLPHRVV
ncbi:MAG: hypothetical protein AB1330_10955 [Bacillota bacterium]